MPGCFETLDLAPNRLEQARRRAAAAGGYIDLTSSNPTHQGLLFPAEALQAAAATYLATRRYEPDPRGNLAARTAIVDYYAGRTPPLQLTPEAVFITASTSEAYSLLFALLTDPGDNLLAPDVTYPLFDYFAAIHRIELRPYRLDPQRNWQVDGASLLAQADGRTRGVLIIAPHNPTGAIVQTPVGELDKLGLPLICDEVFAPFTYGVATAPPLAGLHPQLPVFLLNGISKLFALPDLKLGWIALNPRAQLRYAERLELLNDTFLGASSMTQAMLPAIFAAGMPFVAAMVNQVRRNLDLALAQLGGLQQVEVKPPDGGYYLFPSVHGSKNDETLALFLLERGVLVHPGYFYGDSSGSRIMLSALTAPAQFAAGLERLIGAFAAARP